MTSIGVSSMLRPALVGDVGNQRQLPRPLDGGLQLALVQGAGARDPPRLDLAALRQERREQPHVLVVDVVDLLRAELAHAAATEEAATARPVLALVLVGALAAAPASLVAHR